MAIHARTTFAQVPEVAAQVGFIVEGWTCVEGLQASTPEVELRFLTADGLHAIFQAGARLVRRP